jgi:hypothetical protein
MFARFGRVCVVVSLFVVLTALGLSVSATYAGDLDGVTGYKFKIEEAGGGDWVDNGNGGSVGGGELNQPRPQPVEITLTPGEHLSRVSFSLAQFAKWMIWAR